MSKFRSAIVLKDKVIVPDCDNHLYMINELCFTNLDQYVIIELRPKDGNIFSNIDSWKFSINQEKIPDWYSEKIYKPKVIEAVKKWAKNHIHIGKHQLKIDCGKNHYIKDCENVVICGNAEVELVYNTAVEYICDNAIVKDIHNTIIENICERAIIGNVYDSTIKHIFGKNIIEAVLDNVVIDAVGGDVTIEHVGNAIIKDIYDSAVIKSVCLNATIKRASGYSVIITFPFLEWNNKDNLILSENATLKDCNTNTIYQAGNWNTCDTKN